MHNTNKNSNINLKSMSITAPTQSDTSGGVENDVCACPHCECAITDENAFVIGSVAYCCEFCAEGHPHGEPCGADGCDCGERSSKIDPDASPA
ncbi:MAG: hypothetical protein ACI9R3_005618 [Verrucomicrobiales bacterium]|jgi:hypothetical protein